MCFRRLLLGIAATMLCATALGGEPSQRPVTVFAAASLTNVLQRLGDEFTRSTGVPVRLVFAASSVLARQIDAGAGADVFISADQEWMDYLEQRGGIQKSSRRNAARQQACPHCTREQHAGTRDRSRISARSGAR